jgi:hypothetical protein
VARPLRTCLTTGGRRCPRREAASFPWPGRAAGRQDVGVSKGVYLGAVALAVACQLTGCAHDTARRVSGTVTQGGGPIGNPPFHPDSTVTFVSKTGERISTAAAHGVFSVTLRPGTYTVTGTAMSFGLGKYACPALEPVIVDRSDVTGVQVICSMR